MLFQNKVLTVSLMCFLAGVALNYLKSRSKQKSKRHSEIFLMLFVSFNNNNNNNNNKMGINSLPGEKKSWKTQW